MDLEKFKIIHEKYTRTGIHLNEFDEPEYEEYSFALENDKTCSDWYYKSILEKRQFDYSKHCCFGMSYHLSTADQVKSDHDNPDVIIKYNDKFDEYGIPIYDGGSSVIGIHFCPWCGTKLRQSKRDEWFMTLEKLGYTDTDEDKIPEEFNSDKWYRKSN